MAKGRKCFDGSDDVDGERMSVLSDLISDSNESRDDWDGDMGVSSTVQKKGRASYTRGGDTVHQFRAAVLCLKRTHLTQGCLCTSS